MSRTCDLHDSYGVNLAIYLWDNLGRDMEKIRPQYDQGLRRNKEYYYYY